MSSDFKIISKSGGASFKDLHPTPSAGRKHIGEDLPAWLDNDGLESKYIRCKQCGFPIDATRHSKGSGYGNESVSTSSYTHPITGATQYYGDPTVTGGCPLCGASEYE